MKNFLKENWLTWLAGVAFCLFIALGAFLFLFPLIFGHYEFEMPELSFSTVFWGMVWLIISVIIFINFVKTRKDHPWYGIIVIIFGSLFLSFLITGLIWYILFSR